jgi:hypothetical protein
MDVDYPYLQGHQVSSPGWPFSFILRTALLCRARGGVSIMRTHHPNWLLIVAILLISTMTLYAQRQKHWR